MSTYTKRLAWELETSFVSDEDIRKAISQAQEIESRGEDPTTELGPPKKYAEAVQVSQDKKRRYHLIFNVCGLLALAWAIGVVVAVKSHDLTLPTGLVITGPAFLLLCTAFALFALTARVRSRRFA